MVFDVTFYKRCDNQMSVSMGKWLIFCHFTATANPIETHSDLAL